MPQQGQPPLPPNAPPQQGQPFMGQQQGDDRLGPGMRFGPKAGDGPQQPGWGFQQAQLQAQQQQQQMGGPRDGQGAQQGATGGLVPGMVPGASQQGPGRAEIGPNQKTEFLSRLQRMQQQGGIMPGGGPGGMGLGVAQGGGQTPTTAPGSAPQSPQLGPSVPPGAQQQKQGDDADGKGFDSFEGVAAIQELVKLSSQVDEMGPAVDPTANLRLLEACFRSAPQPSDSRWERKGRMRPPVATPASFPSTHPPVLENPALFERLDTDALFFSFYFKQGTAQQFLAARELKRAQWRFHKKYNTWFARQEEPKASSDEFEQGTYIYFDFNPGHESDVQSGWCQRSKTDFVFEYAYLEDELPNVFG